MHISLGLLLVVLPVYALMFLNAELIIILCCVCKFS